MLKNSFLAILIFLFLQSCAVVQKPWIEAENQKAGTRFIPVELWTGERWNGAHELTMWPADFTFGKRNHKRISGPFTWLHPVTNEELNAYQRVNETKKGTKKHLFTINPDRTGLAKIYDNRPVVGERLQSVNAVLFPLGWWKKGERRNFPFFEYVDGRKIERTATIRIRRLSFTYKGIEHALKYDWILKDTTGKILFHERFIFAPEKSLVYFKNRLKTGNKRSISKQKTTPTVLKADSKTKVRVKSQ